MKRLFFEGRGAILIENWDKAIDRFSKILSAQPDYPGASEQLTEAEYQRSLGNRYAEGVQALQSKNWQLAIPVLGELLIDSATIKMLRNYWILQRDKNNLMIGIQKPNNCTRHESGLQ